jgi:hypothetical protein
VPIRPDKVLRTLKKKCGLVAAAVDQQQRGGDAVRPADSRAAAEAVGAFLREVGGHAAQQFDDVRPALGEAGQIRHAADGGEGPQGRPLGGGAVEHRAAAREAQGVDAVRVGPGQGATDGDKGGQVGEVGAGELVLALAAAGPPVVAGHDDIALGRPPGHLDDLRPLQLGLADAAAGPDQDGVVLAAHGAHHRAGDAQAVDDVDGGEGLDLVALAQPPPVGLGMITPEGLGIQRNGEAGAGDVQEGRVGLVRRAPGLLLEDQRRQLGGGGRPGEEEGGGRQGGETAGDHATPPRPRASRLQGPAPWAATKARAPAKPRFLMKITTLAWLLKSVWKKTSTTTQKPARASAA